MFLYEIEHDLDRRELMTGFIRENLDLLTSSPFPLALYKRKKHEYFLERYVSSKQGVPRDSEVASETVWFLLKRHQVQTRDQLDNLLSKGLMGQKVVDPRVFYEFIQSRKDTEPIIDFKKTRDADFVVSMRERIKEELRKEMSLDKIANIEEAIQRKLAEYEALPSVVDAQEFSEPVILPTEVEADTYLPWWQQLNLTADPFPTVEGLHRISEQAYEQIIVKTPIFQKYLSYLQVAPEEILKNTIYFGEFGSGKTSLFEYLKRALFASQIHSIYVQLYSEKDLQSLKLVFKQKMIEELRGILVSTNGATLSVHSDDIDATLLALLNQFYESRKPRGLVVFIDDLHKNREDFPVSLEFLSYLQIFTSEIIRRTKMQNIAFYVAGALDWEPLIRTQPRYSGSLARRETIPDITEEEAAAMLNKRLQAFYPNPEVKREIDRSFISQVYRDLRINGLPLTFRSFIQRIVDEFKIGNFRVLTSDPVHISPQILERIREILEANTVLKEKMRTLLYEGGIQSAENRIICVRLLIEIFLKKMIHEEGYQDRLFHLQRLARARIIVKAKHDKNYFSWVVCPELLERHRVISADFSLSLEDYLLKLYGPAASPRKGLKFANEEIAQIGAFIEKCDSEGRALLEQSLALHSRILDIQETYQLSTTGEELINSCKKSLELLTEFYVRNIERISEPEEAIPGLEFWKTYWYSPGEVAQFLNLIADEAESKQRIWYVCGIYRQAYNAVFNFTAGEYQSRSFVHISSSGLDNTDVKQLVDARDAWSSGSYDSCSLLLYNLAQSKLRTLVQNILTLLYGDLPSRLRHVDPNSCATIQAFLSARPMVPGRPIHEFSHLSLEEIAQVITDAMEKAEVQNWDHCFSKIFHPLTRDEFVAYVNKLNELKNNTGKDNGSGSGPTSLILRELIVATLDTLRKANAAYVQILKDGLYYTMVEGNVRLYFSLDGLRDKSDLVMIPLRPDLVQALESRLTTGPIPLSDQAYVQEFYATPYRECLAYLALVVSEKASALGISTRYKIVKARGSTVFTKKIFAKFAGEKPPRVFLCHASKDIVFCRTLAQDLKEYGVDVWLDEFEIRVGDSIIAKINEALRGNDYLAIVLSPTSVDSEWVKRELSAALLKELEQKSVVVLPILYKPCQILPLIADKKYANFSSSYEKGLEELLDRFAPG